ARFRVEASKLAVTADTVHVVPDDDRRAVDRMKTIGLNLAVALASPDDRSGWLRLVEPEHQRSVVEVREEQQRAAADRRGDRHVRPDFVRELPVDLAGDRIERGDGAMVVDDQLPHATRLEDDGRGHTGPGGAAERAPDCVLPQL